MDRKNGIPGVKIRKNRAPSGNEGPDDSNEMRQTSVESSSNNDGDLDGEAPSVARINGKL